MSGKGPALSWSLDEALTRGRSRTAVAWRDITLLGEHGTWLALLLLLGWPGGLEEI